MRHKKCAQGLWGSRFVPHVGQETEISPSVLTRVQRWLIREARMLHHAMTSYLYTDMYTLGRFVRSLANTSASMPVSGRKRGAKTQVSYYGGHAL